MTLIINCLVYWDEFILYIIIYGKLTLVCLFVCLLYVRWSYNVCVIREHMILQIILRE